MPFSWLVRKENLFYWPEDTETSLQDLTQTVYQPTEIHLNMICGCFNDLLSVNWQPELQNLPGNNLGVQILASDIGDNEF